MQVLSNLPISAPTLQTAEIFFGLPLVLLSNQQARDFFYGAGAVNICAGDVTLRISTPNITKEWEHWQCSGLI